MKIGRNPLAGLTLAFALGWSVAVEADGGRGLTVPLRASEAKNAAIAEEVELYGSSHALVIGIDKYTGGWPSLAMAVKDARAVASELGRRGFDVTLKLNLTSDQLSRALKEFFAIKGADPEARLFLWYAGHGHTINGEGFLVPADAPPAIEPAFKVTALHLRDFGGLMRLAESKHVLSIFDSCFSGTIFSARAGAAPAAITRKSTRPVRQFLTSGDAGQQVRDDGSFRKLFLRAIRGEERADVNGDGFVTGEELSLYLSQSLSTLTQAAQTPKGGKLHDVNYNQGDFVFSLPAGAAAAARPRSAPPAATSPGPSAEIVFWQSIEDSRNKADFRAYLKRFPNGVFADLARNRLEKPSSREPAAVSRASPPTWLLGSGTYKVDTWAGGTHYPGTWTLVVDNGRVSGTSEWNCCPGHRIDPMEGTVDHRTVVLNRQCDVLFFTCRQRYTGQRRGNIIEGTFSGDGGPGTWKLYLN